MKQTTDNFFCDLVGEKVQIIHVRRVNYNDFYARYNYQGRDQHDVESVWSEGVVRGAYLAGDTPTFLLEKDGVVTISRLDAGLGRLYIKLTPKEPAEDERGGRKP